MHSDPTLKEIRIWVQDPDFLQSRNRVEQFSEVVNIKSVEKNGYEYS